MIDLYTWTTPNGRKISIFLEEAGLPYRAHAVNIGKDEQFGPEFLKISPNNKIPAIIDHDAPGGPLSLFESGAILVYLAEKTGKFLEPSGPERAAALEWLFWQMGGLGPMLGQLGFFAGRAPEKSAIAIERFTTESHRLLNVMNQRLAHNRYLAGDNYSIADMACYAWTLAATTYHAGIAPDAVPPMPHVRRWLEELGARPGVQRGMAVPDVSKA